MIYEALVDRVLMPIIAVNGDAAAGLPTLKEIAQDPSVCRNKPTVGASRVALSVNAEGFPKRGIGTLSVAEDTEG